MNNFMYMPFRFSDITRKLFFRDIHIEYFQLQKSYTVPLSLVTHLEIGFLLSGKYIKSFLKRL